MSIRWPQPSDRNRLRCSARHADSTSPRDWITKAPPKRTLWPVYSAALCTSREHSVCMKIFIPECVHMYKHIVHEMTMLYFVFQLLAMCLGAIRDGLLQECESLLPTL